MERFTDTIEIVIVDDATEDLRLAERAFLQSSIQNTIHLFKDSEGCMEFLRSRKTGFPVPRYLLVIDIVMAPTNGIELLRRIQTDELAPGSLSVMLSGVSDLKQVREAYQLGAKTFLIKPLKPRDIIELIRSLEPIVTLREVPGGYSAHWRD